MDNIGEANKDFSTRVSDLMEEENVKTLVVHQPNNVKVIGTSAFIKTKIVYKQSRCLAAKEENSQ